MKKIAVIISSRKSVNTGNLIARIEKEFKKQRTDVEFQYVNLYDYAIKTCIGCENCILNDRCPFDDDIAKINDVLINSDGVILSSPVYVENVTGIFKNFIDRNCKWFHRSPMRGKPFITVCTTNGSGLKVTSDYLKTVGTRWGMAFCGELKRNIRNIKDPVESVLVKKFADAVYGGKYPSASTGDIMRFQVQKALACIIDEDREYWQNTGMLARDYFYPVKVNIFKKAIGRGFYKFISGKFNKSTKSK